MTSTAIFIPTTAGLRRVCAARFRDELPLSQIRLDGSFAPFPQSQAAHLLVSGPLRGLAPEGHSFDLALDGDIEDGRSWELGFATAWSFARFWPKQLSSTAEQAERVIWVTGAIDMDLAPQAASYFIASKLALSEELFAEISNRNQELWVVAPPGLGEDDEATLAALAKQGQAKILRPRHLQDLLDALDDRPNDRASVTSLAEQPASPTDTAPGDSTEHTKQLSLTNRPMLLSGVTALLVLGVGLAVWQATRGTSAPQLSIVVHHLNDSQKSCGDWYFGGAQVLPAPAQALHTGAALSLEAEGLCQVEFINSGDQDLALSLPTALSRLAIHQVYQSEAQIKMPALGRLTISLRAFPPSQHMVVKAQSQSGATGAFTLDFN